MITFIFWFSLFFILYIYFGYSCLLFLLSKIRKNKPNKLCYPEECRVSIVIAARNEEKKIEDRIQNLLDQTYDQSKLEIIVVSDGSTDDTSTVVANLISRKKDVCEVKIKLITLDENKGKPHALNLAVAESSGEIIVFTDARQKFDPRAIKELTANFCDSRVGSVSGELLFIDEKDSELILEMGIYWRYEKNIRKMESTILSVPGATGAIYAIRRSLYEPIPSETLIDDVLIPLNIIFKGYRSVFDESAKAYDTLSKDYKEEKKRKIRTLLGNYQILKIKPSLLSPRKNPIFFQFISHKVLRLFVPFFFIMAMVASLFSGIPYLFFFIIVAVGSVIAFSESFFNYPKIVIKVCNIVKTFYLLNYFALIAFIYFVYTKDRKIW